MVKIKLFSNYDSSEVLLKRFYDNYQIDDLITYTLNDDYDVAVLFNKTHERLKPNVKVIGIVQEPSWSPCWSGHNFDNYDHLLVHDATLFNIPDNVIIHELPSLMWYHDHTHRSFFNGTEQMVKKKSLSMIVSGINMGVGNYSKRINLLNEILKSDLDIDIFGKGLNINDSRYKGQVENKFTGLLPYKYSIAIENSNEKNYLTEKFIDCFLSNTTPIYNGAPNVNDIYSDKSYKLLDLESPTIINDIKNIIESDNKFASFYNKENKDRYFSEYNIHEQLKKILC